MTHARMLARRPARPLALLAAARGRARRAAAPTCRRAGSAKTPPLTAKLEACTADGYATLHGLDAGDRPARRGWRCASTSSSAASAAAGLDDARDVPSFGVWDGADPGVPGFVVRKRVGGLTAGGVYRAVVTLPLAQRRRAASCAARKRITAPCAQPDAAPDLQLRDPDVVRARGRRRLDLPRRRSSTRAPARRAPFDVALTLAGGAPLTPARRGRSLAGERAVVEIAGAALRAGHRRAAARRRRRRRRRVGRGQQRPQPSLRRALIALAGRRRTAATAQLDS